MYPVSPLSKSITFNKENWLNFSCWMFMWFTFSSSIKPTLFASLGLKPPTGCLGCPINNNKSSSSPLPCHLQHLHSSRDEKLPYHLATKQKDCLGVFATGVPHQLTTRSFCWGNEADPKCLFGISMGFNFQNQAFSFHVDCRYFWEPTGNENVTSYRNIQ